MTQYLFCHILVVFFTVVIKAQSETVGKDYGWRDYEGIIPSDAVLVGNDEAGKKIYIGQVLFENKLIPGKIIENEDKIHFEWYDKEKSTNKNVKILCSQDHDTLKWLYTKHNEVSLLTNKFLISGGYEPNYSTYIGRVIRDGVSNVGKVICGTTDCFGLYTTDHGKALLYQVFQILSYDSNAKRSTFH